jgi:hypothetical protein
MSTGKSSRLVEARKGLVRHLTQLKRFEMAKALLADLSKQSDKYGRWQLGKLRKEIKGAERTEADKEAAIEVTTWVLSGLLTGGTGWAVKAGATALRYGPRVAKAAQVATTIAATPPTQRLVRIALTGKKQDWSGKGLGTDYAFTIGGSLVFLTAAKAFRTPVSSGTVRRLPTCRQRTVWSKPKMPGKNPWTVSKTGFTPAGQTVAATTPKVTYVGKVKVTFKQGGTKVTLTREIRPHVKALRVDPARLPKDAKARIKVKKAYRATPKDERYAVAHSAEQGRTIVAIGDEGQYGTPRYMGTSARDASADYVQQLPRTHGPSQPRLVPTEVKSMGELKLGTDNGGALKKFHHLAKHSPKSNQVSHFEVVGNLKSKLPPNYWLDGKGNLWTYSNGPGYEKVLIKLADGRKVPVKVVRADIPQGR